MLTSAHRCEAVLLESTEVDLAPQANNSFQSVANNTAASLGDSLTPAVQAVISTPKYDSRASKVNVILGQLKGHLPSKVLEHRTFPSSIQSSLPLSAQKKVGLLRAPDLDESLIKNRDYNLAMVQEALRFGGLIEQAFASGQCPPLIALWRTCQAWRIGRLDSRSHPEEIRSFATSRLGNTLQSFTPFSACDERYGYLASTMLANEKVLKKDLIFWEGQLVKRLSIRPSMYIQGRLVPLTQLRASFNEQNEPVALPEMLCVRKEIEEAAKTDVGVVCGVILHIDAAHFDVCIRALHSKVQQFGLQFITVRHGKALFVNDILTQLADIHYLLAHTMLDLRGSAAKSELLVRSLAVAAGLELSAFKKGFVPDLEAFMLTHDEFVTRYTHAFE
jgi:avirulence protein